MINRIISIVAILLASAAFTFGLINGRSQYSQNEIGNLHSQLITQQNSINKLKNLVRSNEAKTEGQAGNIITCSDLEILLNGGSPTAGYYSINQALSASFGGSNTIPLPSHCINR